MDKAGNAVYHSVVQLGAGALAGSVLDYAMGWAFGFFQATDAENWEDLLLLISETVLQTAATSLAVGQIMEAVGVNAITGGDPGAATALLFSLIIFQPGWVERGRCLAQIIHDAISSVFEPASDAQPKKDRSMRKGGTGTRIRKQLG